MEIRIKNTVLLIFALCTLTSGICRESNPLFDYLEGNTLVACKEKEGFSVFRYQIEDGSSSLDLTERLLAINADLAFLEGDLSIRKAQDLYDAFKASYAHFYFGSETLIMSKYEIVNMECVDGLLDFELIKENALIGHLYFATDKYINIENIKRTAKRKDIPYLFSSRVEEADRFILLNEFSNNPFRKNFLMKVVDLPVFEREGYLAAVKLSKQQAAMLYPEGAILLCSNTEDPKKKEEEKSEPKWDNRIKMESSQGSKGSSALLEYDRTTKSKEGSIKAFGRLEVSKDPQGKTNVQGTVGAEIQF